MPPRQQTDASFLSMHMTDVGAKSASLFRFLYNEDNVLEIRDDVHGYGKNNNKRLFYNIRVVEDVPMVHIPRVYLPKPNKKMTRKFPRMNQRESIWWKRFLAQA